MSNDSRISIIDFRNFDTRSVYFPTFQDSQYEKICYLKVAEILRILTQKTLEISQFPFPHLLNPPQYVNPVAKSRHES